MFTIIIMLHGPIIILLTSKIRQEVMKEILSNEGYSILFTDSLVNIPFDTHIVKDFRDINSCWYYTNKELENMGTCTEVV